MPGDRIIDGYAAAAPDLIAPYEALSCEAIYRHVLDVMPSLPSWVIDIGAGTGRDSAWLAARGHMVTAVEPVARFRDAGRRLHGGSDLIWINDRLPELSQMRARGQRFDLVLLHGIWQHLSDRERAVAWPHLHALMAPGAQIILSLRHGPGAPGRPVFPARDKDVDQAARALGLCVTRRIGAGSIQPDNRAAGVHWTWFVLQRRCAA